MNYPRSFPTQRRRGTQTFRLDSLRCLGVLCASAVKTASTVKSLRKLWRTAPKGCLLLLLVSALGQIATAQWIEQTSGTKARLRGVSAVSDKIAWASGAGGTCLKTTDGGTTWQLLKVPGAESLDF